MSRRAGRSPRPTLRTRRALTAQSVAGLSKSYGYDASSRVTSFNHPAGTQNLNYDDRGLLVGSTGPAGNMVATYNADGQMLSRSDPAGLHGFTYDSRGRMSSATDPLTSKTLQLHVQRRLADHPCRLRHRWFVDPVPPIRI